MRDIAVKLKRLLVPLLSIRALPFFIPIIVIMSIPFVYAAHSLSRINADASRLTNVMIEIQSLVTDANELSDLSSRYAAAGDETYKGVYLSQYDETMSKIDKLASLASPVVAPRLQYIRNVFFTLDENTKAIFSFYDQSNASIALENRVADIQRLQENIHNELRILSQYCISMSRENITTLSEEQNRAIVTCILILASSLLICVLLIVLYYNLISRPMQKLLVRVKKAAEGNYYSPLVSSGQSGFVGEFTNYFNRLILNIREHLVRTEEDASLEAKLKQQHIATLEIENNLRKAELKLLQSQINPHFLFNTLNSIGALASLEHAEKTNELIVMLSSLLRYNLKRQSHYVTLREEMDIVGNYLYIQKVRYGARLDYEINCDDEELLNFRIPSMILQPIVENSLIYGIEPKVEGGKVVIEARREGDGVLLTIADNGLGMPKNVEEALAENLGSANDANAIGLQNVVKRLKFAYRIESPVSIDNDPGNGMKVSILLPGREPVEKGGF